MKLFTNPNKKTIVLNTKQVANLSEAIKVSTAQEPDANEHSTQAPFEKIKKCPKCGADMPFLMSIYDESDDKDKRQIGRVENGKWKETEYQAFGIWQCPKCFHTVAEANMA